MKRTITREMVRGLRGRHIVIPEGYAKIGKEAFRECAGLKSVILPGSVESIGKYAFSRCYKLKELKLPNGIKTIRAGAFNQSGLVYIFIPKSVKRIEEGAFSCDALQEINVAEDNKAYSNLKERDGVLYNKDKTVLLAYPAANMRESYVIPGSVKRIGDMAFTGAKNLRSVTIPEGVTEIGEAAFFGCNFDEIAIDQNNPTYSSENGSLYNKDKTELIEIPHCQNGVFIPRSVTNINPMVFDGVQLHFFIVCYKDSYAHRFAAADGTNHIVIGERHDTSISDFMEEMGW